MSCQKRKLEEKGQNTPSPGKRTCFQHDSNSPRKKNSDQQPTRNIRMYTEQERNRILAILEAEFDKELKAKEKEVIEIQERIHKTQRILQYLCYAVVADFYSREKTITSVASTRQRRIHPAVKKLLSGKGPPGAPELPQNITIPADCSAASGSKDATECLETIDSDVLARVDSPNSCDSLSSKEKKVPRYIPPKPKPKPIIGSGSEPVRGGQNKVKTILVVGNVSKWLPLDMRDDSASHKWMVYVRGPKGEPDISSFVSKVRFFLHPSYRPNDVVQVVCPPFHLSRRGWGEFPVRVQVHFSNSLNKPVDIIHNLKLDRTHCGLQTLGSETVAEVWIHREQPQTEVLSEVKSYDEQQTIKLEPDDFDENSLVLSEETQSISTSSSVELSNLCTSAKVESKESTFLESSQLITENIQDVPVGEANEKPSQQFEQLVNTTAMTIKTEPSSECEQSTPVNSTSKQVSTLKSDLITPAVTMPAIVCAQSLNESSPSSPQSLVKPVVSPRTISGPQTTQVSPGKAGTQLVKCIDSKGMVRLLQVRTDLLPKILKKGSTTIPVTPPTTQVIPACINTCQTASPAPPSTPADVALPITKVVQQTSVLELGKTTSAQVSTATLVPKSVVQPPMSQVISQTSTTIPQVIPSSSKVALTSPIKVQGAQSGISIPQGVRPILRFVRPAGNARPMLITPNSTSQQFIRLPANATSTANRPLYVLKDGKLFMMKSAFNAASATKVIPGASSAVSTTANKIISENLTSKTECKSIVSSTLLKTTVTKSVDPIMTAKVAPPVTSVMTSSLSQINANVKKSGDVQTGDTVLVTPKPNLTVNAGIALKPRSSAAIVPMVRLLSPKPGPIVDTVIQPVNKINLAQQFTHPQSVSSPTNAPKTIVKSGKSLLKPAVSLLKSNVGVGIATNNVNKPSPMPTSLQSSVKVPTSSQPPPLVPAVESFSTTKRIVLGRTSGSSTITTYSQQALLYREILRSSIRACPKGPEEDVWRAVRWMVKSLPLINREAKNLEFKILHPYCAPDEKTFCSWNIGKQRACEWQRAKTVRLLLKEMGWDLQNLWTTREIILWARFHGYTPGLPVLKNLQPGDTHCDGNCANPMAAICSYGKISTVEESLDILQKPSSFANAYQPPEIVSLSDESDEEVDIISNTSTPSKVKVKQEIENISNLDKLEKMPLDPSLHSLGDMVTRSLNSIGIHLSSQEVAPGVQYPAAQRMLIQAVQSLAEDLARRAFSEAWGKDNFTRQPGSLETSNICSAICHRPEFDIFTCAGLGISSISDNLPSGK
ncbi:YEATS domain-containing protein 2 [Frankliniella occidentalis]|uniref:YEATS domain-containing protein 2 n=1 Tax=Frankliniella occidentalis TaxID=133901 RepID=A0A6J1S8V3_FRAOC|nr:YEATS domain-containing protein 2 [Frankliniella occidentalis]